LSVRVDFFRNKTLNMESKRKEKRIKRENNTRQKKIKILSIKYSKNYLQTSSKESLRKVKAGNPK
jgi:hypothetical protein